MYSQTQRKSKADSGEQQNAARKPADKTAQAKAPAYLQRKSAGEETLQQQTQASEPQSAQTKVQKKSEPAEDLQRKQEDTTEKQPEEKILAEDGVSQPFVQHKLEVGAADDPMEKEADAVADAVVQNKPVPDISNADQQASRQTEDSGEETVQAKAEDNEPAKTVSRSAESNESESVQAKFLQRKTFLQAKGSPQLSETANQQVEQMRGNGTPLPDDIRLEMQNKLGGDFSQVNIHTNIQAQGLASEIHARAFTVGNDIFFAAGEYDPYSTEGKRLLSHELTHVRQQSGGAKQQINRDEDDTPAPPQGVRPITPATPTGPFEFVKSGKRYKYIATPSPKELHIPSISIPNFKRRHRALHTLPLRREHGARSTSQRSNWENHFSPLMETKVNDKVSEAQASGGVSDAGGEEIYFFKGKTRPNFKLFANRADLLQKAVFPFWDERQRPTTFQVDHCREDQLGGEDEVANYELLEAGANGSSGSRIGRQINNEIGEAVSVFQSEYYQSVIGRGNTRIATSPSYIKQNYNLQFGQVHYNLGAVENSERYWRVQHITQGRHLNQLEALTDRELSRFGNPRRPMLFTSPNGGVGVRAPQSEGQRVELWPRVFTTNTLQIDANDENHATIQADAYRASQNSASTRVNAAYPGVVFHFRPVPGMENAGDYKCWAIDKATTLANVNQGSGGVFQSLRLPGMSPIRIDELDINPTYGFYGRGKLLPTVPFFEQADIDIVIQGDEVRLQKTFDIGELNVPAPFSINYCAITAFMGTRGLGLEGNVGFGIDRLGDGDLTASISTESGVTIEGNFAFDERIFGEGTSASLSLRYANELWTMGGTLTIPEGKVPGVRSATITVEYGEESGFSASGDAELSVPGVERGRLEITQSEEQGFSIGGTFDLSADTPGIRSGSISARVSEKEDGSGYAVSASGTAQPDIPGVNSELTISYNDGAFTAEVTAAYARGMLSGEVNAGVTNRTVNEETGELAETAEEGNPLVVYGGGSLTLQLAPWLQGTAGVRFSPNGEITVTGEIGLPDELEIFARREINKSIFNIAIQAPIVPGIVAEVGGGLGAVAGIGPGVIDQLRLGVEYNPDREEDTRITGDAHLNIPADAGLRLSVRAGIGLGITGASATGGLEIGGTLGIEGAAEAGVHVEWTPTQGLDIEANVGIHAQPSFTFDISGYVSVRALGFSVYDETWELASFSFGSDYRFGINLPIHYQEGQPFDISTDDIEFEVPNIDTNQMLRGLISRIA